MLATRSLVWAGAPFHSRTVSLRTGNVARNQRLSVRAMASAGPKLDIAVKGDPSTNTLGDCPFCHRVLLTLEEKDVPYKKTYINFANKPEWLLQVNPSGTVPVAKDLEDDKWVVDSATISDYVEDKFPQPALGKAAEQPDVGSKLFPAFAAFFKATPAESADKEAALVAELDSLQDWLEKNPGTFIGGESPQAADCALAPKLHHMEVALKGHKGWELPSKYGAVRSYIDAWRARDSWKATHYDDSLVIKGWGAKLPSA